MLIVQIGNFYYTIDASQNVWQASDAAFTENIQQVTDRQVTARLGRALGWISQMTTYLNAPAFTPYQPAT